MNKNILSIGITFLLIITVVTPMTLGLDVETSQEQSSSERYDRYLYPEYYDCYSVDEIDGYVEYQDTDVSSDYEPVESSNPLDGPMDSPWPMHGYDARHTGRSPYSTSEIPAWKKWRFRTKGDALSSPAIDDNGTIYIGSWHIYAVYSNGTQKWIFEWKNIELTCPAIDENGVIYVGAYKSLVAINPNGTKKWSYPGEGFVDSSPTIDDDGVIYFTSGDPHPESGNIFAIYPNGTLKWKYSTDDVIYSTPAIGLDGTVYCGSHDDYIYAIFSNGTLRWKYKTGSWVHGSPTIADDGTVYCGSDDNYLYAFYPNNGTVKWKMEIGSIFGSPALDPDGTIYTGVWQNMFYAINPDGTIKWSFYTAEPVWGSSPALSDDDTIYFGTSDIAGSGGKEVIALYTDGTLKWRKKLATVFSSPAIGKDGTVYIGYGSGLYAFGVDGFSADAGGPYYGLVNQPVQFKGNAYKGVEPYGWFWDFGDGHTSEEQNPIHTYSDAGIHTATLTVTDDIGNISDNSSCVKVQATNNPPNKPSVSGTHYPYPNHPCNYYFISNDPEENPIWYFVDWGDGTNSGWLGPYSSGREITIQHAWPDEEVYILRAKAKDIFNDESDWAIFKINQPRSKTNFNSAFLWFLGRFPILSRLLYLIK